MVEYKFALIDIKKSQLKLHFKIIYLISEFGTSSYIEKILNLKLIKYQQLKYTFNYEIIYKINNNRMCANPILLKYVWDKILPSL